MAYLICVCSGIAILAVLFLAGGRVEDLVEQRAGDGVPVEVGLRVDSLEFGIALATIALQTKN